MRKAILEIEKRRHCFLSDQLRITARSRTIGRTCSAMYEPQTGLSEDTNSTSFPRGIQVTQIAASTRLPISKYGGSKRTKNGTATRQAPRTETALLTLARNVRFARGGMGGNHKPETAPAIRKAGCSRD